MSSETIQSVGRAIAVVRAVTEAGDLGLRLSDVAAALDLHKASASRILNCLVAEAVLKRRADRRYQVHEDFRRLLGAPVDSGRLLKIAQPALSRLSDVLGEVSFLSVRSGYESLCIDRQVGWYPIQALSLDVGSRRPLGVGAGSLALLAWLPDEEVETALEATAERRAAFSDYHVAQLRVLLAKARQEGFTEVRDLVVTGMTGLGVPCFDGNGLLVAALSVAAVSERLSGERRELAIITLKNCRSQVEARLRAMPRSDDEIEQPMLSKTSMHFEASRVGGTHHG